MIGYSRFLNVWMYVGEVKFSWVFVIKFVFAVNIGMHMKGSIGVGFSTNNCVGDSSRL